MPKIFSLKSDILFCGHYTYVDERSGIGIRLEPAATIVRQYGEQFRRPRRKKRDQTPPKLRYHCNVGGIS